MRTRFLVAWITAPIVAVIVVGLVLLALAVLDFRHEMTPTRFRESAEHFFVLYFFFALPVAYLGSLLAAAPAYAFLRRRQQLTASALMGAGALVAALCLEIVAAAIDPSLDFAGAVLPVGLLAGALAGGTFWIIALRSRAGERPQN
jgi:hypothetical protein